MTVTLAKTLRALIYLSAFIPLVIFSQFMSPFHFGKGIAFKALVEIMAVLYLVLIMNDRSYLPPRNKLFWAISIFTLAFGLTTFSSINFYQSFWGTLERMGGWFAFVHFWAFYVILTSVFKTKKDWLNLIKLSLFVSLLSAFYGFLQKTSFDSIIGAGGRNKIFGTIGNPALFAGYMIFGVFLSLTMLARAWLNKKDRWFYFTVFVLGSLAVLLSGVRGSVLALVIGITLFGFSLAIKVGSARLKKWTLAFVVLVFLIGVFLVSSRNSDFIKTNHYLARYADISPKTYTVFTRLWAWQAGFDGWNDSFKTVVLGYGPENFNIPFSKHFNPNFFRGLGSETLFDRAHNQFVEILVTMGLIGFVAYIWIFAEAFKTLKNITNQTMSDRAGKTSFSGEALIFKIGLTTTLVAYVIHNSFIFDTTANFLLFFVTLGFINFLSLPVAATASPDHSRKTETDRRISFGAATVGVILMFAVLFLIYYTGVVPAKANYATTRGIIESWNGRHKAAVEKFKEAVSYDTFGKYDIRHRFGQYVLEQANKSKLTSELEERLLLAIESIKKNTSESNQDYLPFLYISRAYILLGRPDPKSQYNDLALEYANKARKISPTFVRTYYEIAQTYLNRKDYKTAADFFKQAIDLNPTVGLSWWYLGATQIEGGEKEAGVAALKKAFELGYDYRGSKEDLLRLVNIFYSLNDFENVARFYKNLIEIEPGNAQFRASLAVVYSKIGKIDEAVAEARKAAALDLTFQAEARDFIRKLGREW